MSLIVWQSFLHDWGLSLMTLTDVVDAAGSIIGQPMDHVILDKNVASWIKYNHYDNDHDNYLTNMRNFAVENIDATHVCFSQNDEGRFSDTALQHGHGNVAFKPEPQNPQQNDNAWKMSSSHK